MLVQACVSEGRDFPQDDQVLVTVQPPGRHPWCHLQMPELLSQIGNCCPSEVWPSWKHSQTSGLGPHESPEGDVSLCLQKCSLCLQAWSVVAVSVCAR